MSGLLQFTVRLTSETEAMFTSVERLLHYIDNLKAEAPSLVPDKKPANDWPKEGSLSMLGVKVSYLNILDLNWYCKQTGRQIGGRAVCYNSFEDRD
jgi:hypothetical protein